MISSPFILNLNFSDLRMVFIKPKSTATNIFTYLNSITLSFSSQGQTDSVYFYLSQAFDKVPHTLLLQNLSNS
jgi:hypothetical protein